MRAPSTRTRRFTLGSGLLIAVIIGVGAGVLSGGGKAKPSQAATAEGAAVNAARFAKTACMVYPPTSGDRHLTVFLDAGHGGLDPGSVGETRDGKTIYEPTRHCRSSSTRWRCCARAASVWSSRAPPTAPSRA
jgi:N-acetylmuramoyl-L-alanine amidase